MRFERPFISRSTLWKTWVCMSGTMTRVGVIACAAIGNGVQACVHTIVYLGLEWYAKLLLTPRKLHVPEVVRNVNSCNAHHLGGRWVLRQELGRPIAIQVVRDHALLVAADLQVHVNPCMCACMVWMCACGGSSVRLTLARVGDPMSLGRKRLPAPASSVGVPLGVSSREDGPAASERVDLLPTT